ncbi:patatin-like phospholipase family protein [Ruminiclostridium papyrosolvens]|uniref:Patatin n=1 Tax=Ruminiclostridium papyrosolvens C7 TaxID=1330534 RepID=U4QXH6_9FIRM|nr:patatin-like phospholipase family protein [Ruminiclostridium papyrosolvens]EPR09176.1 patatin [Ruminiclostridium papyrosolvens C7]
MNKRSRTVNIVLSGGGIKGIAFAGAYDEIEKKYKRTGNIAGVSAGALVGSLIGAGYTSSDLGRIMKEFDFSSFSDMGEIPMNISIANSMRSIEKEKRVLNESDLETLLHRQDYSELNLVRKSKEDFVGSRGNFLVNLIAFSKKNAFLNGELLESWVAQLLANKGIRTFSDFRGGIADKVNPRGYKVRMTAVDANTGKVIVLPDDMALYNIDPDKLEVAKAVRMSTCVPFVFDPVTIEFKDAGNKPKTHYIIDGGVLDNFPVWLIDSTENNVVIGLKLEGKEPKGLSSAEHILKKLLHSSHDTGVPKNSYNIDNIAHIYTGDISFLDFDITAEESLYLYNQGKLAVQKLFVSMQKKTRGWRI